MDSDLRRTALCGPLFFGLIRTPARRSIGWASSEMGGYRMRSVRSMRVPSGLTIASGGIGAERTRMISAGGFRYGSSAAAESAATLMMTAARTAIRDMLPIMTYWGVLREPNVTE